MADSVPEARPTKRRGLTIIGASALVVVWLAMMIGGTGSLDLALLQWLYAAHEPAVRSFAMFVTIFGNWQAVIFLSLIAAGWLLSRGHRHTALLLLGITLIGRVLVELQKFGIHRLRPSATEHLVPVKSLSFPSAHAANSMILLLTLALLAPPREQRWWTVPLALFGTFCVGISRPMLGVHWPSDVIGGWSFGAAWVLVMVAVTERWPARKEPVAKR